MYMELGRAFIVFTVSHVSNIDPRMNLVQMVAGPSLCPHQSVEL